MRKFIDRGEPGCDVPDDDILLLVDPITVVEMQRVNKHAEDVELVELETSTPDGANRAARKLMSLLGSDYLPAQIPKSVDQATSYLHERAGEVIPVQISALTDCDRLARIGSFLSDLNERMLQAPATDRQI